MLSTVAGVTTAVVVGLATESVVLALFWALLAGYVLFSLAATRSGVPVARRAAVTALAAATAVGVLVVIVSAWDATWLAAVVSLVAGAVVDGAARWLLAPATADSDRR